MNTTEMIKTLAARLQITQKEARRHLHNMFTTLSASLQKGEKTVLRNFGALSAAPSRPVRTYDAATKEFVSAPSKIEIFFRPYKRLKDHVEARKPA
ncbi:MAG: HU family DNA-binding protein [bacterium]